jgi:protein phosphatase
MDLDFYQLSAKGDRQINQDCMASYVAEDYAIFIVADGLGGHHAGEKASKYFCQGVLLQLKNFQPLVAKQADPVQVIAQWMDAAVAEMRRLFAGDEYAENAHTTCAILYLDRQQTITVHCGDSRIYKLDQHRLLWRTRDHSLTQKLLDEGKITEQEMAMHPEQNQLTRSISIQSQHRPDIHVYPAILSGECFVLCSDGFWEYIKESELHQLAITPSLQDSLKKMIKLTVFRAAGRSDNVTVQVIRAL